MAAFADMFDERVTRVDANARLNMLRGDDDGITLDSADDGTAEPLEDEEDDSSFHLAEEEEEEDADEGADVHLSDLDNEPVSSSPRQPSLPASDVGASDDGGDGESMPAAVHRVQRTVVRHINRMPPPSREPAAEVNYDDDDPSACPLCWEEQPYIEDSSMRTAMADSISDFRRIIFRFERMLAGRQADVVIFRGMLELRRLYVERDLERYSGNRFQRWTMAMLRRHYSPLAGHRFDIMRELDQELADMRRQKRWIMEHAMFVTHPESGERVFNIRAVDTHTRVAREYSRVLDQKRAELLRRNATAAADVNMVMQAINSASNMDSIARKRQRRGVTAVPSASTSAAASQMYEVGGL